ncbi:MAG: hypothetical protein KA375_13380 [Vitreoscilla sp.]|nr:hypothetical protein [Burkholderiales bacterium]MBP6338585.1 hypothetical protein [Vitreoscilla sp.]MBP6674550.1 hypothetical protein [Vitreoscilla sp.]
MGGEGYPRRRLFTVRRISLPTRFLHDSANSSVLDSDTPHVLGESGSRVWARSPGNDDVFLKGKLIDRDRDLLGLIYANMADRPTQPSALGPSQMIETSPLAMNAPVPLAATSTTQEGDAHWHELIGQIGSDVGQSLTRALERVNTLTTTGRIDRESLRALRVEIEHARRAGMIGQQLARYASGRIRQSPEQVSLTQMMRDLLLQRGREASVHGLEVHQSMRPAEVISDATLLHALLQAVLDWSLEHARQSVEYRIEIRSWPANARLICRFPHHHVSSALPGDVLAAEDDASSALDTLAWRLVQQLARTLDLMVERQDESERAMLAIEFPRTVSDQQLEGVSAVEVDQGFGVSEDSKPLAGSHVLVVANRRDLKTDIRECTRHMGLLVDFVNSVEEAEVFCQEAVPHAIVYESALAVQRFDRLCSDLQNDLPGLVLIEVSEEGTAFELTGDHGRKHALVGRDSVMASLPSALFYELSRAM